MRMPPLSAVFSPRVRWPLSFWPGATSKPSYSLAVHSVRSWNFLRSSVGPPDFLDVAVEVVLGALVVEAVGHLVADDDADAAEVDRRVGRVVEEGRLQDAGGEVDVVLRRHVVGVHGGRRHAPLGGVDGLAELGEVALVFEDLGAEARCRGGRRASRRGWM